LAGGALGATAGSAAGARVVGGSVVVVDVVDVDDVVVDVDVVLGGTDVVVATAADVTGPDDAGVAARSPQAARLSNPTKATTLSLRIRIVWQLVVAVG